MTVTSIREDVRMEDRERYSSGNQKNNISTEKIVGNIVEPGVTNGMARVFGHKILWQCNENNDNVYDLVFNQDGFLYSVSDDGKIMKIDPATGVKISFQKFTNLQLMQ